MPDGLAKPARWWPGIRAGHPLSRDCRAFWPFWEGQAGQLYDAANPFGVAHDGTLTNMDPATDWVPDRDGIGLKFTAADNSNRVVCDVVSLPAPAFSLWAFFRVGTTGNDQGKITTVNTGNFEGAGLTTDGGKFRFLTWGGGTFTSLASVATADSGALYSLLGVRNADGTLALYVNDVAPATAGASVYDNNLTDSLMLGRQYVNLVGRHTDDTMFAAGAWSRGLIASEAAGLWSDPYALIRQRAKTYMYATGGAPAAGNRRRRILLAG